MKFFEFFQWMLPRTFLNDSYQNAKGVYMALGMQFDDLKEAILNGQDQLFIDSATYMLPVYEAEFAIQLVDQSNIEARRNNVMAMSRGGLGSTPEAISGVLKSYGYSTQINEDYPNYTVSIQFTDYRGVPSNIADLQALMKRFIPGHLKLEWKYSYYLVSQVQTLTIGQLQSTQLNKFAPFKEVL